MCSLTFTRICVNVRENKNKLKWIWQQLIETRTTKSPTKLNVFNIRYEECGKYLLNPFNTEFSKFYI